VTSQSFPVKGEQVRGALRQVPRAVWVEEPDLVGEGVNELALIARVVSALQSTVAP
jgi:hypothetical protein